ncbi:hypothetical protein 2AV2_125 [Nodularia phage vB_NpeS-2AV2]|jgi:hypothetical protein|uniref:Uncharacterized protein n=3 Tax=Ravarandavirus TaxID=2843444 RepID=A0A482MJK8_9CAUD|nr:hypothetical protein HWA92_gp125 [Nodularia phage vB_NpeS-2AV2]YP_009844947.1 hypothetical protein HWC13_gp173 [Nodularia phage vB_NspS-kac68v161]ALY07577.1 hypothetical protein 2AV2_125 [Nodularia phage vB_NpeS-2AV2]QBQ73788.1 hypothetical protein kac68v161_gp138 [Nodularia phage vB_NspS-kac68v161]QBQ73984.1 hypothetical protein kac68v162_gp136 [Nodularia phage vB_NspS-kac68v162]
MTRPKIHYIGDPCCNSKGRSPLLADSIYDVTCQGCIAAFHGKKLGGRPPKNETKGVTVAVNLSPKAYDKLQSIPSGDRSGWVSELIEKSNEKVR